MTMDSIIYEYQNVIKKHIFHCELTRICALKPDRIEILVLMAWSTKCHSDKKLCL